VKISFIPRTKEDYLLLLKLAKEIRLASKESLIGCTEALRQVREDRERIHNNAS
jgi:hypothetical protein